MAVQRCQAPVYHLNIRECGRLILPDGKACTAGHPVKPSLDASLAFLLDESFTPAPSEEK